MRVYGSSPLYNYVELVFRSKRLFIVSIVLTTLVVATMAAMRAGTYTARGIALLSGTPTTREDNTEDAAQRGSVRYKINVLNIVTKDPNFYKQAFKDAGLNEGMSEEEFEEFCKEARKSLSFATGENMLQITCTWRDPRAANIVKAFYDAYARRVFEEETVLNRVTTKTLEDMYKVYVEKVAALEKRLAKYQKEHVGTDMLQATTAANQKYLQQEEVVKGLRSQLSTARTMLQEIERQLASTERMIEDVREIESITRSPQFQAQINQLYTQKSTLETQLEELRKTKTEEHPLVKQAVAALEQIQDRIKSLENMTRSSKPQPGNEVSRRMALNPQWLMLDSKRSELDIQVQDLEMRLANAIKERDEALRRAQTMPEELLKYKTLTDNLPLYTSVKQNLSAKLEQARIDEFRNEKMSLSQMKMVVEPISEPEDVRKSMLFYAAGPILGLVVAFAFSLLAETLDHSLRTPVEVEKYLGKPVLAVLPRMDTPKGAQPSLPGGDNTSPPVLPS